MAKTVKEQLGELRAQVDRLEKRLAEVDRQSRCDGHRWGGKRGESQRSRFCSQCGAPHLRNE